MDSVTSTPFQAIISLTRHGAFQTFSQPFIDLVGYDEESLQSMTFDSLSHSELTFSSFISQVLSSPASQHFAILTTSSQTQIKCNFIPLFLDEFSNIFLVQPLYSKSQITLEMAETIIDLAGIGYWILDLDTKELLWNDHIPSITETPLGHVPNYEVDLELYEPEDRARIKELVEKSARDNSDFHIKTKRKTFLSNTKWIDVSGRVNNQRQLFGVMRDITDEVAFETQQEEQIKHQQELLQQLRATESALKTTIKELEDAQRLGKMGFFYINRDDRIIKVSENGKTILGLQHDESEVSLERFVPHIGIDWSELLQQRHDRLFETGESFAATMPYALGSETKQILFELHPTIFDDVGKPVVAKGIFQDLTELVTAKNQAERANSTKSRFLGYVSHEIRTPLNSIMGLLSVLKDIETNSNKRCLLQESLQSANLLLSLVNNIIDLYRIECQRFDLEVSRFTLSSVVDSLTHFFASDFGPETSLEWLTLIDPEVYREVTADQQRLLQILINLIRTIQRFATEGFVKINISWIASSKEGDSGLIRFTITASGAQVPELSHLKALFDPFQMNQNDLSLDWGLGLAISQGIARLMGSEIKVERDDTSSGIYFDMELILECTRGKTVIEKFKDMSVCLIMKDSYAKETLIQQLTAFHIKLQESTVETLNLINPETSAVFVHAPLVSQSLELFLGKTSMALVTISYQHHKDELEGQVSMRTGNRYTLTLPILYAQLVNILLAIRGAIQQSPVPKTVRKSCDSERFYVLAADDQLLNRRVLTVMLEQMGIDCQCVDDGRQAVDLYKKNPFDYDLIILDYRMPMSGSDTARAIRDFEKNNGVGFVSIICLTADASLESKIDSLESGMNFWLSKPVTKHDLAKVLEQFLPLCRRKHQNPSV
ncbi:hypothetical protein GEMRC1_005740 [Eukaryota sp. GEM-RC1]